MTENTLELWYWKIPGRASLPYVMLKATKQDVLFSDQQAEAETFKSEAPFGQLPVFFDRTKGVVMAQSAGIAIYVARICGLDGGSNLRAYSQVLQFIELEAELSSFIGRALYTGESGSDARKAAWEEAKKKIDVKLERVVSILGSNDWLSSISSPSAADFAVATILWLLSQPDLWPELPSEFPALAAHSKRLLEVYPEASATFEEMNQWEAYYKR